jgi:hypothetical protein
MATGINSCRKIRFAKKCFYLFRFQPIELDNSYLFTSKRKENYLCLLPTPQTTILVRLFDIDLFKIIRSLDIDGIYSIIGSRNIIRNFTFKKIMCPSSKVFFAFDQRNFYSMILVGSILDV